MARKTSLNNAQLKRLKRIAAARKRIPTNKQLAAKIGVSERTIESYISRFMWRSTGNALIAYDDDSENDNELDKKRIRQLLQLCHPDKHHGSRTAHEISQWLLQLKSHS